MSTLCRLFGELRDAWSLLVYRVRWWHAEGGPGGRRV
jgi:hypothetical protein